MIKNKQNEREKAKAAFFEVIDKIHAANKDLDTGEIEEDIEEAVQAVRLAKR